MMTVGDLVAFNGLLMQVTNYVASLTWAMPHLVEAAAGMQRIEEIFVEQPRVRDGGGAELLPPLMRGIEFQKVTFSYAGDHRNLNEVDLCIPQGATVAVVGRAAQARAQC